MNLLESLSVLRCKKHNNIINKQTHMGRQSAFKAFQRYLASAATEWDLTKLKNKQTVQENR